MLTKAFLFAIVLLKFIAAIDITPGNTHYCTRAADCVDLKPPAHGCIDIGKSGRARCYWVSEIRGFLNRDVSKNYLFDN
jgi:hypothetical protein